MLRLIGSHYHFRRAVPQAVQACLGRTEISLSLQTQSKLIARERAAALYAATGTLFERARMMDEKPDIRPHPEDGWSPKTSAGTRIIPIHSSLLRMEGLNLVENNGAKYLFPDLTVSTSGERGDNFARSFSKHKKRLGLPEAVTFHSFRHTVSTKLRNQEAHIRELWIDTVLGHEASHKSQGTMNYTSGIEVANLKQVIEALHYPAECIIPF